MKTPEEDWDSMTTKEQADSLRAILNTEDKVLLRQAYHKKLKEVADLGEKLAKIFGGTNDKS